MSAMFSELVRDCLEIFMDDFQSFDPFLMHVYLFVKGAADMRGGQISPLLGEIPFYSSREDSARASSQQQRVGGVQGQNRSHQEPSSYKPQELRGFLSHVDFYRRFIKDFAKISKPLTNLLSKDVDFVFDSKASATFLQ